MIKVKLNTTAVETGMLSDFFIYPNPTSGYLKIRHFDKFSATQLNTHQPWPDMMQFTRYAVSDVSGKIVLSGELIQNSFGQFGIEMSALPKGLYFVEFSSERINKAVKVVKE